MKKRNGFVSNSSSSSFIVSFEKDPMDINNLRDMMGDCGAYTGYGSHVPELNSEQVIEFVHRDLTTGDYKTIEQHIRDEDDLYWEASSLYESEIDWSVTDEYIDFGDLPEEQQKQLQDRVLADKIAEFRKKHTGEHVYVLEYSDEYGVGCALEHGDIFRNVTHTRISNH